MPDPLLIVIAVALAAFVFFQFRNSRKRQRETAERQAQILPGVEIMTNFGLYGTLISVDDDTNMALIESTPGTVLKIHRQTILKVVEPESEVPDEDTAAEPNSSNAADTNEPEFGERVDTDANKPARKSAKKTGE